MLCPVCEAKADPIGSRLRAARRIGLHACRACGHRFGAPRGFDANAAYDDPQYAGFRPDPFFEKTAGAFLERTVVPRVPRGSWLLDVGCGNGAVLRLSGALGLVPQGIDVSDAAVRHCRELGLQADVGNFPTHDFGTRRFHVITLWDVLEHLESPRAFVERAYGLLAPGGLLVAKVPGHKVLSVQISSWIPRLAGAVLQVPHHLQLFTDRSLRRLVSDRFDVVSLIEPGQMRSGAVGGPLRRRAARRVVAAIHRASGDRGLLLVAQRH